MALIDTVPTTRVTVPTFLKGATNGKLDEAWLRFPDAGRKNIVFAMFEPVSYAMQALHLAAARAGHEINTTGRYRTYAQQVTLFRSRYKPGVESDVGCGSKRWDSDGNGVQETWYLQRSPGGSCYAMAAGPDDGINPGSNHGLGLADDIAEDDDADTDTAVEALDDPTLIWMRDNAQRYGFGLETRKERWHWHWIHGDALSQVVVDELYANGVSIPDLAAYQFFVPRPTALPDPKPDPPEEDDVTFICRTLTNPYEIRIGAGNGGPATVLRSHEYARFVELWKSGTFPAGRKFHHPMTGEVLAPGDVASIPQLDETDADLWIGYPDYVLTGKDEG